ncbi:type I polyketide synthase [Lentzea sp. NPDC051213]|uniref:type I polyketide synthase n=1 Tax=Lentzea sp. NPDC051213 TaxID=3364126 RepID=UPI00379735FC
MSCSSSDDRIAIVGMACRYPGGISSPEDLWALLLAEKCVVSDLPSDRGWDLERLGAGDPNAVGSSPAARGGFLEGGADFDAEFFRISPREAAAMHPEQRLVLETGWEALERAGLSSGKLQNERVGVFVGAMSTAYGPPMHEAPADVKGSVLTGTAASLTAGRLSYFFGFTGPVLTVDTAQSGSLVAMHLAAQALRTGECGLALAGGVTFAASPGMFTEFSKHGGLASDGRCKPFAAGADGTVWSEGAGMVVLARLSDARRLGCPVLACLRSSAVNHDGASSSLIAPNGAAQEELIRRALAHAGLTAADVDAVEAHGTGTRLGDPAEAGAILATYGQDRHESRPLWLGSVKSNLGHTQAAAGVAGVIKMVMAMRSGLLPKTLHVDEPAGEIDWSAGSVRILTEHTRWPATDRPRRSAVSSFGISGTNAHLVLEQAPAEGDEVTAETLPFVISGTNDRALRAQANQLRQHVQSRPDQDIGQVAWSLATRRERLACRAVVLAQNRDQLVAGLGAVADGTEAPDVLRGAEQPTGAVVFLMTSPCHGLVELAQELMSESPAFAARVAECADVFPPHCDFVVGEAVRRGADVAWLRQAGALDAAVFGMTVALAELWTSCGVRPDFVIGASRHQLAAAHLSGVLSIEDAARLAVQRGEDATGAPDLAYCGAVTGDRPEGTVLDADHWYDNARGTARFGDTVRALVAGGEPVTFIEIGPRSALLDSVQEIARDEGNPDVAVHAVQPGTSGRSLPVLGLSHAYLRGATPRWETVFEEHLRRGVDLPTYAFQRQRYWLDPGQAAPVADRVEEVVAVAPRSSAHDEPSDDRAALIASVRAHVAAVLGYGSADAVPINRPFKELGLDSIGTQALSVRISEDMHRTLATSSIYDYATVTKLADYLQVWEAPRISRRTGAVEVETMDAGSLIKLVMGED